MKANESIPFVTGANRGIGRAIVEAYLAHGVKKVYAAARRTADLQAIVALDPKRVVPVTLDVVKPVEVLAAADLAKDVNVLINNAGALNSSTALEGTEEELRQLMEVNYFGLLRVTRAFAPTLEKHHGAVANLLSIVSFVSMPVIGGYNASKAAAWSATMSLRADLGKKHVRVFSVFPGPIDTDMAKGIDMPKTPPSVVAEEILRGIAEGTEDIFPDPMSKQVYAGWKADHKALEKQFAG